MPYRQMNVFTDYHHDSLLQSLRLLFEKRLGMNLYRPIGMEWFEQGFWKINNQMDTAAQFLLPGSIPLDGTPPLNDDISGTLTLDEFFKRPIDIVIASIPAHIEPFKRLCELHPNKPKLIFQMGNQWDTPLDVRNVLSSAHHEEVPESINYVEYHQEFDTSLFYATIPVPIGLTSGEIIPGNIFSFVNVFEQQLDYPLFLSVEQLLPGWNFKSFGGQCRDGNITGAKALAEKMRESRFIWHTKRGGDGYGHILHNAAAVGRPVIVRKADYSGQMGDKLLLDGETCIAIDGLVTSQIVDKIMYYSEPQRYSHMCRDTYENFVKEVNFDIEQADIEHFLSKLY